MPLPIEADQIVLQGYLYDELTGAGLAGQVTSEPVALPGQSVAPMVLDAVSHAHIQTRPRTTSPDATTGYWALMALASNDPDVEAYGGRKVTLPGQAPRTIQVPYDAPQVTVTAAMAAQLNPKNTPGGVQAGDTVRAIWFHEAAGFVPPPPGQAWLDADQTVSTIASGIEAHDQDPDAHPDIRALIGTGGGGSFALADATDLDQTGAAPGQVVAVGAVDPLGFSLIDPPAGTETPPELTPMQIRTGVPISLGGAAAWSLYTANPGTVTDGTDPAVGPYVRIATTGQTYYRVGRDLPFRLDGGQFVSMLIRRNDANLTVFDLYASLGGWGTSPASKWNKSANKLDIGDWRRIVIHPQEQSETGVITDYEDLRSIVLQPTPAAGTDTSIDVADIRIHPNTAPIGRGTVSLIFDDARLDTYTEAFPRMAAYGMVGSVGVEHTTVQGATGGSGPNNGARATVANLHEMYDAGWDMCGHHTAQMTSLSAAEQIAVHQASKAFLSTQGFRRGDKIWIWPGGARSFATEAIARRYWRTLRRTSSFYSFGFPHVYEPLDPALFFYNTATTPIATATDRVDKIAASGGHGVLVFHSLVASGATAEDCLISDFETLLAHIEAAGVRVVPISEVWTA